MGQGKIRGLAQGQGLLDGAPSGGTVTTGASHKNRQERR